MAADMKRIVEALLFASPEPLSLSRLKSIVPRSDKRKLRAVLDELKNDYDEGGHAFQLREIGGGWRVVTRPKYSKKIEEMLKGQRRVRLSKPALECLSVIAYRQPCTRIDVENVRGVNCGGSMATLLERGLITISGRAETLGRPLLYGTSAAFLAYLGINSIEDLPQIVEIESLLTSGKEDEESATIAPEERRERLYASMETIAEVIADAQPAKGNGKGNGNGNGDGAAMVQEALESPEALAEAAAAELGAASEMPAAEESVDSEAEVAEIIDIAAFVESQEETPETAEPLAETMPEQSSATAEPGAAQAFDGASEPIREGDSEGESVSEPELPREHEEILREELAVERASLEAGPRLARESGLVVEAAEAAVELAEPQDDPEP